MASAHTELARELSAILTSPYPVSLAKLAHVCTKTDALTVRACIRQQPPCAIAKLASSLYDALPVWQCCISILDCLSQSPEFKYQLISRNPTLLDALITKANSSQQDFDQYHGLCIQLLVEPLPEAVPLPASVHAFFMHVFDQALRKPSVQYLKPIYYMLTGACHGFLTLLPLDARQKFDEKLCNILTAKIAPENFVPLLWCFGITILAEHPELMDRTMSNRESAGFTTAKTESVVKWNTAAGRKLFGTSGACKKTVNLACLSVIWAIRESSGVPDDEALQGIRIATRALQLVDHSIVEQWAHTENKTMDMVSKLLEKIQRCDLKPVLQREALYLYAVIGGPSKLSRSVVDAYEVALMDINGWGVLDTENSLSSSLPLFAGRMQQASVQSLLQGLLKTNISPVSIEQVQQTTALIKEVTAAASHCEAFCFRLVAALSEPGVQADVEAFLACCGRTYPEDGNTFCQSHNNKIHRECLSATVSMLLTILLAVGPDQSQSLPPSLGIALIEKQCQLSMSETQCTHTTASRVVVPSVSLFEQQCTPISGLPLQDWRSSLRSELENQATYQRDSLIRVVAQICHDLESRCENVEGPLRSEREKSLALKDSLDRSRACVESLELKCVDHELFLNTLESEKSRLEKDNEELSAQLESLRIALEKSNSQADTALREAEEAYNYKAMHLRSVILQHEETAEHQRKENETFRGRIDTLENELAQEQGGRRQLAGEFADLQTRLEVEQDSLQKQLQVVTRMEETRDMLQGRLEDTERELSQSGQTVIQKDAEIARMGREVAALDEDVHRTRAELMIRTEELEDLQTKHNELAESSTKVLQELEALNESKLEAVSLKAADEYRRLHESYDLMRQDLERAQISIPPLRLKIREYEQDCLTKEAELEELRAWQSRVLDTMRLAPPEPAPARHNPKAPHQHVSGSQQSLSLQIEAPSFSVDALPQTTGASNDTTFDDFAGASMHSSSQLSQHGSTPKRPKPRPLSRDLSARTSYNNSTKTSKRSKIQRPALRPISPNRRHSVVGGGIPEQKDMVDSRQSLPLRKRRGSSQGGEATDFELALAASTPFTPGNFTTGTGRWLEEDESIAEL